MINKNEILKYSLIGGLFAGLSYFSLDFICNNIAVIAYPLSFLGLLLSIIGLSSIFYSILEPFFIIINVYDLLIWLFEGIILGLVYYWLLSLYYSSKKHLFTRFKSYFLLTLAFSFSISILKTFTTNVYFFLNHSFYQVPPETVIMGFLYDIVACSIISLTVLYFNKGLITDYNLSIQNVFVKKKFPEQQQENIEKKKVEVEPVTTTKTQVYEEEIKTTKSLQHQTPSYSHMGREELLSEKNKISKLRENLKAKEGNVRPSLFYKLMAEYEKKLELIEIELEKLEKE
ncbi:MAG: hypothetical protein ACTSPV_18155 [Candidatus Hodarchaeales archaeon]